MEKTNFLSKTNLNPTETEKLKDLYIISCIFNPAGYQTRTNLYKNFEKHILESNINLITIECIFSHQTEYFVTDKSNPNHIQVYAEHPLWIKENLINIAIKKLPINWKYVLWLDSDIEFLNKNWPSVLLEAFEKYDFIQCFKYSNFLGPNKEILETHYSLMYAFIHQIPIERKYFRDFYPHPGYGWGMKREAYELLDGVIDFSIVGSGDMFMSFSLINKITESLDFEKYSNSFRNKLLNWQKKANVLMEDKKIGYADLVINHYFHGFRKDRQYVSRNEILFKNEFDPEEDLYSNNFGVLQIKQEKQELIENLTSYFISRKEDKKIEENEQKLIQYYLQIYKTPEQILQDAEKMKIFVEENRKKQEEILKEKIENENFDFLNSQNLEKKQKILNFNLDNSLDSSNNLQSDNDNISKDSSDSDLNLLHGKKIELFYELNIENNIISGNTTNSLNSDSDFNNSSSEKSHENSFSNKSGEIIITYGNSSSKKKNTPPAQKTPLVQKNNNQTQNTSSNQINDNLIQINSGNTNNTQIFQDENPAPQFDEISNFSKNDINSINDSEVDESKLSEEQKKKLELKRLQKLKALEEEKKKKIQEEEEKKKKNMNSVNFSKKEKNSEINDYNNVVIQDNSFPDYNNQSDSNIPNPQDHEDHHNEHHHHHHEHHHHDPGHHHHDPGHHHHDSGHHHHHDPGHHQDSGHPFDNNNDTVGGFSNQDYY